MRFVRARLTTFDDPHYRAFVEQMTLARENQRAIRPPRQRDLFGGEAEQLLVGVAVNDDGQEAVFERVVAENVGK